MTWLFYSLGSDQKADEFVHNGVSPAVEVVAEVIAIHEFADALNDDHWLGHIDCQVVTLLPCVSTDSEV